MAEPSMELIGRQLQVIQAELRELKFAADVERRNTQSAFGNLVAALGTALGTLEVKIGHRIDLVRDQLVEVIERLAAIEAKKLR